MTSTNTGTKSSCTVLSRDSTDDKEAPPPLILCRSTTCTDLRMSHFQFAFHGFNHQNCAYWDELSPSIYNIEVALDWISQADAAYIKHKGEKQTAL